MKRQTLYLLAALACATGLSHADPPSGSAATDPFLRRPPGLPDASAPEASHGPMQVSIRWEVFSLEAAVAAALMREGLEGKALYDKVVEKLAKKEATQESLIVVQARSGEKAVVEGVSEVIYPTEYRPPYAPATEETIASSRKLAAALPAVPENFWTRNAGWTMEIMPTLGTNDTNIDLTFMPGYTVQAGVTRAGQGLAETEMPLFDTSRLATALSLKAGRPFFVGTFSPSPVSQADPQAAKRVWLAFITPAVVRP